MSLHISANKLAEFITAKTPERRKAIVRALKRTKKGYAPWYAAFETPAKQFLLGGAKDGQIIESAIERMKTRKGRRWLDTDSRITTEAFRALLAIAPTIRAKNLKFKAPGKNLKAALNFPDVVVTVTPDLIVCGERNDVPLLGSLRFYLAKESAYQLTQRGAELVSVMQHQWLSQQSTGERTPDTTLCMVLECFQQRLTSAPADFQPYRAAIEQGAQSFVRFWNLTDDEAAA